MYLNEARDLLWIASTLYAFAVLFGFGSTYFTKSNFCKKATLIAIVIGFTVHTRGLYLRGLEISGCPLGNSLERIQFITWSLILTFLILRILWKLNLLGSLCSGMAAVLGSYHFPRGVGSSLLVGFNLSSPIFGPVDRAPCIDCNLQLWDLRTFGHSEFDVSNSKKGTSFQKIWALGNISATHT